MSFAVLFSKSSISRSPSYYRLYDNDSEAVSKSSFEEYDSFLGRIDTFTILPLPTVASPEDCLVHVKGGSVARKRGWRGYHA